MKITILTQKDLKAYVDSLELEGINVYRSITKEVATANLNSRLTVETPYIVCECTNARHDTDIKGNWWADAAVIMRLQADDTTEDQVEERCEEMADAFCNSELTTLINAQGPTGYTVLGSEVKSAGCRRDGTLWEIYVSLEIYCCASDVS